MSLTSEQIKRIAHLARIEVDPAGLENARHHLNGIFSLIETMQAADTSGVAPMSHPQDVFQRLREDIPTHLDVDGKMRGLFQSVAPETKDGLYLVPKVIE